MTTVLTPQMMHFTQPMHQQSLSTDKHLARQLSRLVQNVSFSLFRHKLCLSLWLHQHQRPNQLLPMQKRHFHRQMQHQPI